MAHLVITLMKDMQQTFHSMAPCGSKRPTNEEDKEEKSSWPEGRVSLQGSRLASDEVF
jgi:hypothetical protein